MATATTDRPNKVEVTDAGPSRKKLRIEVPAESVAESLGLSMDTLMAEAELPGFRRGHVPRRLVERKFGTAVRKQAKEQIIASAYSKAIEDHKLRVIANPSSDSLANLELVDGQPLVIELEVEVMPEFKLPSLDGIEIRKPTVEVTDDMVQKELDKLLVQEGRLEERSSAEPGDYLTGHAKILDAQGKSHFEQDGIVVQVPPITNNGKGMIVGLSVDDLAAQLGTPAPGQKSVIRTRGPENYEFEELRGEPMTIEYTPSRVDRIIPTTVEDALARFGMSDVEQLKTAIRARLNQRVQIEQISVMRAQITRYLIENTSMDLPERVTADQARRNLERRRLELMYRGMDPAKVEESVAELRSASAESAVRELKLFFILNAAAEDLKVNVTEAEVNGRIAQIAQERGERPDRLRNQLIASNQINGIAQQIREHKTIDFILSRAKISDMPAEEFNRLMREQREHGDRERPKGDSDTPSSEKPAKTTKAAKSDPADKSSDADDKTRAKSKKDDKGEAKSESKTKKK
jgi:trigger factor